jgi:hypothetical protein
MKFFKSLLIALVILASFLVAQPSFADKPKFLKNPDYIEVTKALDNLQATKAAQSQTENSNPEDIQKKIDELEFQKYALETGSSWGQCRNETGKTIAVYGPKPDLDDDDEVEYQYDNGLYFLANGQTTKKKWDCNGVYLASGVKTAAVNTEGQVQELDAPVAIKIFDGTQLVITTNSDTDAIEFSTPAATVFKAGDANWFIPNVTQAVIETRVPNAPTAKIKENQLVGLRTQEKDTVEVKVSPETRQSQPQAKEQPESQPQLNLQRAGYFKRA